MWPWRAKMPTQNLLRLLLLLMLMLRIMLTTVCWFGSWRLVIKLNFCSAFKHKVRSRFWCWSSGDILKLEFVQHFAADVLYRLWSWILVEILKLGLVGWLVWFLNLFERLIIGWEVDASSRFWRWNLIKICVWTCIWPTVVTLVSWTQPSGPLCLWQCIVLTENI